MEPLSPATEAHLKAPHSAPMELQQQPQLAEHQQAQQQPAQPMEVDQAAAAAAAVAAAAAAAVAAAGAAAPQVTDPNAGPQGPADLQAHLQPQQLQAPTDPSGAPQPDPTPAAALHHPALLAHPTDPSAAPIAAPPILPPNNDPSHHHAPPHHDPSAAAHDPVTAATIAAAHAHAQQLALLPTAGTELGPALDNDEEPGYVQPFKGCVYRADKRKYTLKIRIAGAKRADLGYYPVARGEEGARLYDALQLLLHGPRADTNFEWSTYSQADVIRAAEALQSKGVDVLKAIVSAQAQRGSCSWLGVSSTSPGLWQAWVRSYNTLKQRVSVKLTGKAADELTAAKLADRGHLVTRGLRSIPNFPASTYSHQELEETADLLMKKGVDEDKIKANLLAIDEARKAGVLDTIVVSIQTRQHLLDQLHLIPPQFTYQAALTAISSRPQAPEGVHDGTGLSLHTGTPGDPNSLALVPLGTPGADGSGALVLHKQDDASLQIGISGYHGLCAAGQRWRARTAVNKKHYALGGYRSAVSAAKAWDKARLVLLGTGARPNFPAACYTEEQLMEMAKLLEAKGAEMAPMIDNIQQLVRKKERLHELCPSRFPEMHEEPPPSEGDGMDDDMLDARGKRKLGTTPQKPRLPGEPLDMDGSRRKRKRPRRYEDGSEVVSDGVGDGMEVHQHMSLPLDLAAAQHHLHAMHPHAHAHAHAHHQHTVDAAAAAAAAHEGLATHAQHHAHHMDVGGDQGGAAAAAAVAAAAAKEQVGEGAGALQMQVDGQQVVRVEGEQGVGAEQVDGGAAAAAAAVAAAAESAQLAGEGGDKDAEAAASSAAAAAVAQAQQMALPLQQLQRPRLDEDHHGALLAAVLLAREIGGAQVDHSGQDGAALLLAAAGQQLDLLFRTSRDAEGAKQAAAQAAAAVAKVPALKLGQHLLQHPGADAQLQAEHAQQLQAHLQQAAQAAQAVQQVQAQVQALADAEAGVAAAAAAQQEVQEEQPAPDAQQQQQQQQQQEQHIQQQQQLPEVPEVPEAPAAGA